MDTTILNVLVTGFVGFGLVGCGYLMARRDTHNKFVALIFELDKAGLCNTDEVIRFLRERERRLSK